MLYLLLVPSITIGRIRRQLTIIPPSVQGKKEVRKIP